MSQGNALTAKQRKFCLEYIKDFNGTRAAIEAGYSKKTARQIGSKELTKIDVQAFLKELLVKVTVEVEKQTRKSILTAADVQALMEELAVSDPAECMDDNNNFLPIKQIPPALRRSIKSFKVKEDFLEGVHVGNTVHVEFWDKGKSLDQLGRIHQMFVDRQEVINVHVAQFANQLKERSVEELAEMAKEQLKLLEGK